jgi:hypothetical protein
VLRQIGLRHLADGPFAEPTRHDAVVVEHCHTVGREPYVALETVRAEAER